MKVKIEVKKQDGELLVHIVEDNNPKWVTAQHDALKKLTRNLKMNGFREGQVPPEIAKKAISQKQIFDEATFNFVNSHLLPEANKEIKPEMEVIGQPSFNTNKVDEKMVDVTLIYPIYPTVDLGEYQKVSVKFIPGKVTAPEVDAEINKIIDQHTMWKMVDRPLALGDKATFDFEGFIDSKPFDGGKAVRYELEIGSKKFIAGFEDQMLGMKVGESRDVTVQFPDNYQVEVLKNKTAVFKVKLHEIKVQDRPLLTDTFIQGLKIRNVANISELKAYLHSNLQAKANNEARQAFQQAVFTDIKKVMKVTLSDILLHREMENQAKRIDAELKKQNSNLKNYRAHMKLSDEDFSRQMRELANNVLKDTLVYAEIARLEKLDEVVDADYDTYYHELAKSYWVDEATIKNFITRDQAKAQIINNKVIDKLIAYTLQK